MSRRPSNTEAAFTRSVLAGHLLDAGEPCAVGVFEAARALDCSVCATTIDVGDLFTWSGPSAAGPHTQRPTCGACVRFSTDAATPRARP